MQPADPAPRTTAESRRAEPDDDDLRQVVAAQAEMIDALRRRLDALEGREPEAEADEETGTTAADVSDGAVVDLGGPTSRRNLMTKGVAAAAGAVIGGTAIGLASAAPAAAAAGVFDGNPAVTGTANPTSGVGVSGVTTFGYGVFGQATAGCAVLGQATGGYGVRGDATGGDGVRGLATSGQGVSGSASVGTGIGVRGENFATSGSAYGAYVVTNSPTGIALTAYVGPTTGGSIAVRGWNPSDAGIAVQGRASAANGLGVGVWGESNNTSGTGVYAQAAKAVQAESGRTQLLLSGTPAPPLGAGLSRSAGEVVFDTNKDLWLCVASGTPGTWRRISGPNSAGALTVLASTTRIYDSRPGTQPPTGTKTKYQDGDIRPLDATGNSSGVPANAQAVMISATATNTNSGGFFSFYKTGIAFPGNSNLNWGLVNSTVAVTTVVACGAGATFNSRMQGFGGSDLVIDVIGYYL